MPESFHTIKRQKKAMQRDQGSKFLAYAAPVKSTEDFDAFLHRLKSSYPDATHHCYAWRINPLALEEFSQDDGEPSGTAGLPILNAMKSADLCNVAVIVVRYFGGTKLGKSGLIKAYGDSARDVIQLCELCRIIPGQRFLIQLDYPNKKYADQIITRFEAKTSDAVYLEQISYTIDIALPQAEAFREEFHKLDYLGIEIEEKGGVLIED